MFNPAASVLKIACNLGMTNYTDYNSTINSFGPLMHFQTISKKSFLKEPPHPKKKKKKDSPLSAEDTGSLLLNELVPCRDSVLGWG